MERGQYQIFHRNGSEIWNGSGTDHVTGRACRGCPLRVVNLPNYVLDRLSRYEVTLWRQVGQILFALGDRKLFQGHGRSSSGSFAIFAAGSAAPHSPPETERPPRGGLSEFR
jgi:hypothetical protein